MTRIISIHSFRGGTGKSNTTANLAALMAADGLRVGIVDTDIQSPGLHVLFGLRGDDIAHSLNDFLWGKATIAETAVRVSDDRVPGALYLVPASIRADEIVQILRQGYDMKLLAQAFREISQELKLDALLIDTHPGLNEETLFSLAISSAVVIVLRPDQQDYEGTGVTIEVARSLQAPRMLLIVNKAPPSAVATLKDRVEETFGVPVAAVLPHSDEMLELGSQSVFVLDYPEHPITAALREVARRLVSDEGSGG